MTPFEIGLVSLAAMAGLVMSGLFVPVALMLCSYVGVWAIKGSPLLAGKLLALAANDAISSYFFGVVPLFVLMGFITAEAGLGRDAFQVANHFFRRIRGGLGLATIGANAAFAAVTGISIASAAVFARLAVPEMTSRGYTAKFATGIVAGSSVLGMLIPPSLLLILYALLTEQSVGDLFLAGLKLIIVPLVLFFRHYLGAYDVNAEDDVQGAARAFWGSAFTVLSFLTTTGFISADWSEAQAWSGLGTPGLLFMGLAVIGGGVATTAGGVKLLRVFALYLNGLREMERLVHPSSISGGSAMGRRLQKGGAFIAWIFFMLFALSLAFLTIALTATGVAFETSLVIVVAGLSTTGPLLDVAAGSPISLAELSGTAKGVFVAAMVLGRLEMLAIIALLTPDLWRG